MTNYIRFAFSVSDNTQAVKLVLSETSGIGDTKHNNSCRYLVRGESVMNNGSNNSSFCLSWLSVIIVCMMDISLQLWMISLLHR